MTDAVWPDGARGAVTDALRRDSVLGGMVPLEDQLLTALEPFVQQRINTAVGMQTNIAKSNEHSLRAEVARLRQERDHANALAEAHRLAVEGARETLNEERVERSQAEQILADVDADRHRLSREVARLREDGERYEAVLRLLAVDVLYCHRGDDGVVTAFINLNDYFIPAADGEAIAMDDAPALAALYDQGGWPAISQWVADRRGIPNQHWRKRLDAARSAPGGEG